jgi:6-phosphofructokinase 1
MLPLYGAVIRANELRIEIIGLIKGFSSLQNPQMPHIRSISELDHTYGGTILGTSRHYIDDSNQEVISEIVDWIKRLQIDGLVCVGGDGTLNGMQVFSNCFPTVLTPKTIDNDLGLNYLSEPSEWRPSGRK